MDELGAPTRWVESLPEKQQIIGRRPVPPGPGPGLSIRGTAADGLSRQVGPATVDSRLAQANNA
jgi:hypothetical protein